MGAWLPTPASSPTPTEENTEFPPPSSGFYTPAQAPQAILHIFKSLLFPGLNRAPRPRKTEKEITKARHLSPSPHPIYQGRRARRLE